MRSLALLLVVACSSPSAPVPGVPITPSKESPSPKIPVVDSHVHLAFYPVADELAKHGVLAAVDMASPESSLHTKYPIRVIHAGPMLTHPGGYPLDAWGSDGYGVGCVPRLCIAYTLPRLQSEGVGLVKIALDDDGLDPALAAEVTKFAHLHGLKVAVHALTDASARAAGEFGADILAHTPLEPLSDETIAAWQDMAPAPKTLDGMHLQPTYRGERAVITTLAAFGGSDAAIDNLRKLRAAGLTVLYGTDLGNLRVDGPSEEEMALMRKAGMSDDEVHAAMTTVPWRFWHFDEVQAQ